MTAQPSPPPSDPAAELDLLVERSGGMQLWRRAFHVACGLAIVAPLVLLDPTRAQAVAVLAAILALQLALDAWRLASPAANVRFYRLFPTLVTPRERRRPASSTWFALGALVAIGLFPRAAAIGGILVLAFADPAANVVGRRWGRTPFGRDGTLEGTLAFLGASFTVLLFVTDPLRAAGAAALATAGERLLRVADDNLVLPVVAAAALGALGVG